MTTILFTVHDRNIYRAAIEDSLDRLTAAVEQNRDNPNFEKVFPGLEIAGQLLRQQYPGHGRAPMPEWLEPIEEECGNA